jgi:hypothetical protein
MTLRSRPRTHYSPSPSRNASGFHGTPHTPYLEYGGSWGMFTWAAWPISEPLDIFAGWEARMPTRVMETDQSRSGSGVAGTQPQVGRRVLSSGRDAWLARGVEAEMALHQAKNFLNLTGRWPSPASSVVPPSKRVC